MFGPLYHACTHYLLQTLQFNNNDDDDVLYYHCWVVVPIIVWQTNWSIKALCKRDCLKVIGNHNTIVGSRMYLKVVIISSPWWSWFAVTRWGLGLSNILGYTVIFAKVLLGLCHVLVFWFFVSRVFSLSMVHLKGLAYWTCCIPCRRNERAHVLWCFLETIDTYLTYIQAI